MGVALPQLGRRGLIDGSLSPATGPDRAECGGALGFCQAGRYAVQAHGFVDRPSKDVDLFTTMAAISDFATAQAAVADALRADGLEVTVERESPSFARLAVGDPVSQHTSTVELGVD